ncbi:MAG: penicillin acylase family protein [Bdellovibrionales bacterium]|nr:penicillin acylase family protein [Bdellovibrionales bacterium]
MDIFWDEHSIPFVHARLDSDGFFALGAVHAHLRLGQMELFRRLSQGRLSEVVGPLAWDIDQTLRILDLGKSSEEILSNMPSDSRKLLERFVEGINWYQENVRDLPLEFKALQLKQVQWTPKEIVTLSRLAGADLSWIFYFSFLRIHDPATRERAWKRFLELGLDSPASFSLQPATELDSYLAEFSKSGSNALAVSGGKAESGAALLASDPHLGIYLPNFWLLAGLSSESFHCVGMMIPGLPFFALGRNSDIAWGGTNLRGISSHLFRLTPSTQKELSIRKEILKTRGWFNKEVVVRDSTLGPVISDAPFFELQEPYALSWVGHRNDSDEITAFLRANRAKNFEEFREAFSSYAVSGQNMLFADRNGNIGQVLAYAMPKLSDPSKTLSLIKDQELYLPEVLKSNELPFVFNPESGYLASANNQPVAETVPFSFSYSNGDRYLRLKELAEAKAILSLEDLMAMQLDVFSSSSLDLRNALLPFACSKGKCEVRDSLEWHFKNWDGRYNSMSRGALAFEATVNRFGMLLFDFLDLSDQEKRLIGRGGSWNASVQKFMGGLSDSQKKFFLKRAFEKARTDFERYQYWGKIHRQVIQHPLGNVPPFGFRYRTNEYGAEGGNDTLLKSGHPSTSLPHTVSYGAQARQLIDLADQNANYFVLLGGQDGWIGSPQIDDQVSLWRTGRYVQIPLDLQEIRDLFHFVSIMTPPLIESQ